MSIQVITFHLSFSRFKLHLGSKVGAGRDVGSEPPPLPLTRFTPAIVDPQSQSFEA